MQRELRGSTARVVEEDRLSIALGWLARLIETTHREAVVITARLGDLHWSKDPRVRSKSLLGSLSLVQERNSRLLVCKPRRSPAKEGSKSGSQPRQRWVSRGSRISDAFILRLATHCGSSAGGHQRGNASSCIAGLFVCIMMNST